jgi:CelD/BcsL family acetyltransferase involved in cellulose biosynthesis
MDSLVDLHRQRWHTVGEPGAFSRNFESFLREAVRDALRASRCLFSIIKIDGRIQAALVGFVDNGVVHYFQKGFNPEYARDEIGNVIVALSIRACTEDPRINRFDFMGGGAPYKSLWAREVTENVVVVFERPTFATTLINACARLDESMRQLYRRVVPLWVRAARRDRLRRRRMQRLQLVVFGLCEPLTHLGLLLTLV